jgi:hypothetical protein
MGNIGILDFNTIPNWMITSQRVFIQNHPVSLGWPGPWRPRSRLIPEELGATRIGVWPSKMGFKPVFFGNRNGWIWVWGCLKMAKWSAHLWPYYAILIYIRTGNEVPKHEVASLFSDNPTYHRYHLHGYLCPDVVEDHFSIWGSPLPNKMGLGPLRASHPTRWTEWLGLKAQIFWHTHTFFLLCRIPAPYHILGHISFDPLAIPHDCWFESPQQNLFWSMYLISIPINIQ